MKLQGAWRRDYSEFFDTQEALLIDAMDNADSIYTVFARLQSLAVKCGCAGKLLLHESVPYTDEMLAAVTKKTVPAFRQCVQPLVQLGLVICEDGIYAIADWESTRTPRQSTRCARETANERRKSASGRIQVGRAQAKKSEKFSAHTSKRIRVHPLPKFAGRLALAVQPSSSTARNSLFRPGLKVFRTVQIQVFNLTIRLFN